MVLHVMKRKRKKHGQQFNLWSQTLLYYTGLPEVVRPEVQRVQIMGHSHSSDSDSSEDEIDTIEADITMETSSEEEDNAETGGEGRDGLNGISNAGFTDVEGTSPRAEGSEQTQVEVEVMGTQMGEEKVSNHIV